MSLVHMFLRRVHIDERSVEYVAVTGDFSPTHDSEPVARILIDKMARTYRFVPLGPWVNEKVIPPTFYGLPESEQRELLEGEYQGFGCGAWTGRLHTWVTRLIARNEYPEAAPQADTDR